MRVIRFRVEGHVVPQARPRGRWGSGVHYDPPKCRDYKRYVALVARANHPGPPLEGPLEVSLTIARSIPASWPKKRRAEALSGVLSPTSRPDIDNLAKGVLDGLSGILWKDDALVVRLVASKRFDLEEYVEVEVAEVQGQGSSAARAA